MREKEDKESVHRFLKDDRVRHRKRHERVCRWHVQCECPPDDCINQDRIEDAEYYLSGIDSVSVAVTGACEPPDPDDPERERRHRYERSIAASRHP